MQKNKLKSWNFNLISICFEFKIMLRGGISANLIKKVIFR
jgi:hypothetical protein